MSWGVEIIIDHDDGYTTTIEAVSSHTYNLTPMWRRAGIVVNGTKDLDGLSCRLVAPLLSLGLIDAVRNSEDYLALNPENGWGDYEGFIEILMRFCRLAWTHPTGTLRWNG